MLLGFVIALLVAAVAAPTVHRLLGGAAGWALAAVPGVITLWFLGAAAGMVDPMVGEGLAWAPSLGLSVSMFADGLGVLMGILVAGVGAFIVIYAGGYMEHEPRRGEFLGLLLFFMASMLGLVLADNLLIVYVFWELTTVSSWLLIGFKNEKTKAREAAWQSLMVTVIGGLCLLVGLILLGVVGGSFELSTLIASHPPAEPGAHGIDVRDHPLYTPILLLILAGAFTKSAQFPFHFWLPNAMMAPTPVSAYLHSAAMVKAGVYLLARLNPVLGETPQWWWLLVTFGTATMLFGGWMAVAQRDAKKVLAYSTVSSLGIITMLVGLGGELGAKAAVMILFAHSLYKATMFMVVGSIDHAVHTRQLARLGGLWRAMPLTATAAMLGLLAMAGIPPALGFIAEDEFFRAGADVELGTQIAIVLGILVVVASVPYTAAAGLVGIVPFFGRAKPKHEATEHGWTQIGDHESGSGTSPPHPLAPSPPHAHESPPSMWIGPIILGSLGIVLGILSGMLGAHLIAPAVEAVLGEPIEVKLAIWHGLDLALGMAAITLALAVPIFFAAPRLRRQAARLHRLRHLGPNNGYFVAKKGVMRLAEVQTVVWQHGYLPWYVLTMIVVTAVGLAYVLLAKVSTTPTFDWTGLRWYDWLLAALILMAAVGSAVFQSRLVTVASMGVVGIGVAAIFIIFGAPDVGIVQVLIETIFVVLFVLVLYYLPSFRRIGNLPGQWRDAAVCIGAGALVTLALLAAQQVPFNTEVIDYYLTHSAPEAHGRNVVNVILVDFRALDTLAEIAVLAIAAVGVVVLMRLRPEEGTTDARA